MTKKVEIFFGSGSASPRSGSTDPDTDQNGKDPSKFVKIVTPILADAHCMYNVYY